MAPAPPSSPAPERLSADARRTALLDAARALVAESGPAGVTMGAVAERASVTRALVYKHFAHKEEVLVALYRREARRLDRRIAAEVEAAPEGFEPKLRAFVGATLDALEEHGPFFTPLREAGADPRARQDQRGWDRRTVGYFAERAERDLGIDGRTARSALAVLFSGLRSLLAQMRSRPGAAQRRQLVDTYVEMTIGGLTRLAEGHPSGSDHHR
ncbi:TetR/AcrR family transcriptional regulator [Iamia majanohamensis]|uniref:TetR/AcrR family transcriptional regulator n=1 Tax=Iamia majanohamensis TaxID=467976 RepID=A0AAE9YGS4_9ACTN|nr:TetR/AcrR family transcriptional regulator [Iamia majanohamensis]WCO67496.1 TetR/AcrR family transcriptional regulator [Iamia majanohamensis]